jgi:hypothetical protein
VKRYLWFAGVALVLALLLASPTYRLPTSEEARRFFAADLPSPMLVEPMPEGVPVVDATDLAGWAALCDRCHRGPQYDSHTILIWAHREDCLSDATCVDCHTGRVHCVGMRGTKTRCFDCHLARRLPLDCTTCHAGEFAALQPAHEAGFMEVHGAASLAESPGCFTCHGSQRWCFACHGMAMPHPPGILGEHPGLAHGAPQRCARCHGDQSCTDCHAKRGVRIN